MRIGTTIYKTTKSTLREERQSVNYQEHKNGNGWRKPEIESHHPGKQNLTTCKISKTKKANLKQLAEFSNPKTANLTNCTTVLASKSKLKRASQDIATEALKKNKILFCRFFVANGKTVFSITTDVK